ncbi:ImuA family protein [Caulobacter sp. KR2-114]|uniref:ImuA family protein n=1 Tax=Caulobacter sp. KR2-114 TaxID=3400912 RepID=UPI003C1189D7
MSPAGRPEKAAQLKAVRASIAAIEAGGGPAHGVLPFGDARIDAALPGGGLPLGRWHEVLGEGLEAETGAVAAAFAAALIQPLAGRGATVWVMRRDDLYAPGLAGLGFPAERLIQVLAKDEAEALSAVEDALGTAGVSAVVGEVEGADLVAGRRLQLACERHGATGLLIRRRPFGGAASAKTGRGGALSGSLCATRWRIAAAPSDPGTPGVGMPWLGPSRWTVALERCRGGRTGTWLMEKSDGAHPLRLVADLGDRELAPAQPVRLAG